MVIVRDPELKRKMGDWGARPAATAGVVLLVVMQNENPSLDEARLAERRCLATTAHGVGSTVATLKNEGPAQVNELLGIPAERRAVCVAAIGHTDAAARQNRPPNPGAGRMPMAEFAHWDRF